MTATRPRRDRFSDEESLPLCAIYVPNTPGSSESDHAKANDTSFLADDIVRPVARSFGYRVERLIAPESPPASFARDLDRILSAELSVFDLTHQNPDICFAAGLRYMTGRPILCCLQAGAAAPFSLAHVRPISYARQDLRSTEAEIVRRLSRVLKGHPTEARPFFEVLPPRDNALTIGGFTITADVLANIEDRLAGRANAAQTHARPGQIFSRMAPKTGRY